MKEEKPYKIMTRRQWDNLDQRLKNLEAHLLFLEENLPRKRKRYLRFDECIPPNSVCKDVVSMLEGIHGYDGFIGRLSEYYDCDFMKTLVDPGDKVSKNCLATYYPFEKVAYSAGQTVSRHTVLHEFFHHLIAQKVVIVNERAEEHWADKYADIFITRSEQR